MPGCTTSNRRRFLDISYLVLKNVYGVVGASDAIGGHDVKAAGGDAGPAPRGGRCWRAAAAGLTPPA
jgi:hypothetical protein